MKNTNINIQKKETRAGIKFEHERKNEAKALVLLQRSKKMLQKISPDEIIHQMLNADFGLENMTVLKNM